MATGTTATNPIKVFQYPSQQNSQPTLTLTAKMTGPLQPITFNDGIIELLVAPYPNNILKLELKEGQIVREIHFKKIPPNNNQIAYFPQQMVNAAAQSMGQNLPNRILTSGGTGAYGPTGPYDYHQPPAIPQAGGKVVIMVKAPAGQPNSKIDMNLINQSKIRTKCDITSPSGITAGTYVNTQEIIPVLEGGEPVILEIINITPAPLGSIVENDSTKETYFVNAYRYDGVDTNTNFINDFSTLKCINKDGLTGISQPQYGDAFIMKAKGDLQNGTPVVWSYGPTGFFATTAKSLPSQHDAVGICLEKISDNNTGKVLVTGFATAKFKNQLQTTPSQTVLLTNTTNNTIQPLNPSTTTTFQDSGGPSGNYTVSQNYQITFDSGVNNTIGDIIIEGNFGFEHTTFALYDRLGIQSSDDNITYSNIDVDWFNSSAESVPPYSNSYGSGTGGWILPEDQSTAVANGFTGSFPANINVDFGNHRYIKYIFFSDGSAPAAGWSIEMSVSGGGGGATNIPVSLGETLYLENNYTGPTGAIRLTSNNASQIIYGYAACEDSVGDNLLIRLAPPRFV